MQIERAPRRQFYGATVSLQDSEFKMLFDGVNLRGSARENPQFFGGGSDAAEPIHDFKGLNGSQARRSRHVLDLCEGKLRDLRMDLVLLK